jgi:hypothetical protein
MRPSKDWTLYGHCGDFHRAGRRAARCTALSVLPVSAGLVLGGVGGRAVVGVADPQGVGPGQSGSTRERGGPSNVGSTKRAAQTVSLAAEGKSVQTYPPSRTVIGEERERIAPNHQADGQLSPRDAALHMTDVALIAWPPDRYPSSTERIRVATGAAAHRHC